MLHDEKRKNYWKARRNRVDDKQILDRDDISRPREIGNTGGQENILKKMPLEE